MEGCKIVVTGMGAVTPIGIGVRAYWDNLIAGKCGVARATRIDTEHCLVKIAAEVRDFDPAAWLTDKQVESMDSFMYYAYVAAEEALRDSGLPIEQGRTGVVMGTALDGLNTIARTQYECVVDKKKVSPRFVPKVLGNLAAAQFAIEHRMLGPSMTVNTACASGIDAIGLATMVLRLGEAESMVVMGGEAGAGTMFAQSLARAFALSQRNDDPQHASRPFDKKRDGFVIGEGGGALVLETEAHAQARGAKIYAELAGFANNTDGFHVIAPDPEGKGAAASMRRAMELAGVAPEQVDYINAHGTSTIKGDQAETAAIKLAFGPAAYQVPISSTKGATGHLMGAGGVTEAIACILAIRDGIIPPTINYEEADPLCDLDYVPNVARRVPVRVAMSNAFGFGSQNASVIFRAYD